MATGTYQPERGDDVEIWIKRERDKYGSDMWDSENYNDRIAYLALDNLLDDYRLHSDTGVPLLSEEPMQ